MTNAGVNWDTLTYRPGDTLKARIVYADSGGDRPRSVSWRLIRNNHSVVGQGASLDVQYVGALTGLYRLMVTTVGNSGETGSTQSTVLVSGDTSSRVSLPVPPVTGTLVLLGSLYSQEIVGNGGTAQELPWHLLSEYEDIYLLPGTTHVTFELDPYQNTIEDDVVVRTRLGNWTLRGGPSGLNGHRIGYNYRIDNPAIPAPADLKLTLGIDAFRVNGELFGPFNFRVRVNCWRETARLYRYEQCPYSIYPGGEARRQRRFVALFTDVTMETDVDSPLNRLQATSSPVVYRSPEVTTIPGMPQNATATPHISDRATGIFFTEGNRYAIYESETALEVDAKAVSAIEGTRPCCISFQTFGLPKIAQRVKRVSGQMAIYMGNGVLIAGSTVRIAVETGKGLVRYTLPVTTTVYPNEDDLFALVGHLSVDLDDFQFSRTGIVLYFDVVETLPTPEAPPEESPVAPPVAPDVNTPPTINAMSLQTFEDVPVAITLTGSDAETPDIDLIFTILSLPTHGVLSGTAPNVTYTPDSGYFGFDSFTFMITDTGNGTAPPLSSTTASVTIEVLEIAGNTPPTANPQSVTTNEDSALGIALTGTDLETPGSLTFNITQNPAHGSLTGSAPSVTYTPDLNYFGSDSFKFTVTDAGALTSAEATVSITVNPINDPPTANPQLVTTNEDTATPITLTGSDVEVGSLTYTVTQNPAHGVLTGAAPNLTYTPASNYNGADSFKFTVTDTGALTSAEATVSITVNPVNDAPTADSQSVTTPQEVALGITLTASDVETSTGSLIWTITQNPANGVLTGAAPNLTYTPGVSYFGPDSFKFTVTDTGDGASPALTSAEATVSITVTDVIPFASDVPGTWFIFRSAYAIVQADMNPNDDISTPQKTFWRTMLLTEWNNANFPIGTVRSGPVWDSYSLVINQMDFQAKYLTGDPTPGADPLVEFPGVWWLSYLYQLP